MYKHDVTLYLCAWQPSNTCVEPQTLVNGVGIHQDSLLHCRTKLNQTTVQSVFLVVDAQIWGYSGCWLPHFKYLLKLFKDRLQLQLVKWSHVLHNLVTTFITFSWVFASSKIVKNQERYRQIHFGTNTFLWKLYQNDFNSNSFKQQWVMSTHPYHHPGQQQLKRSSLHPQLMMGTHYTTTLKQWWVMSAHHHNPWMTPGNKCQPPPPSTDKHPPPTNIRSIKYCFV